MISIYRIWHIPQIPMSPYRAFVDSPKEGAKLLNILAQYDDFQYQNNIKPDYSNAAGLEVYEDGEWVEWHDENGDSVDLLCDELWEQESRI